MANTIIVANLLQKETIRLLDKKVVIAPIANGAYTGQLKKQGDTVEVETFPNVKFDHGTTAGDDIAVQDWAITSETLVVNEVLQGGWKIKDIEQVQSNLQLQSQIADRIAVRKAQTYDQFVADLAAKNPNTALNDLAPSTLSKTTVLDQIELMRATLSGNNAFDQAELFVNPTIASLIRLSDLYVGIDAGFKMREAGGVGMFAGFKVYETNNLPYKQKITLDTVATADDTIAFSIPNPVTGSSDTVTFTAKAAPSNPGEFDVAASAAAQAVIVTDMINGTGTPGATSYIELSAADRSIMKRGLVYCGTTWTSDATELIGANGVTCALSMTAGTNVLGTLGTVMFASDRNAINLVKQLDGFKITDGESGFYKKLLVENVYDGTVFTENKKRIVTADVTNGA